MEIQSTVRHTEIDSLLALSFVMLSIKRWRLDRLADRSGWWNLLRWILLSHLCCEQKSTKTFVKGQDLLSVAPFCKPGFGFHLLQKVSTWLALLANCWRRIIPVNTRSYIMSYKMLKWRRYRVRDVFLTTRMVQNTSFTLFASYTILCWLGYEWMPCLLISFSPRTVFVLELRWYQHMSYDDSDSLRWLHLLRLQERD